MNHSSSEAFIKRLTFYINLLRNPISESFNYNKIIKDSNNFIKHFHDGYKKLHLFLISDIMTFESLKDKYVKNNSRYFLHIKDVIEETILILRRINDAIAWIMLGMDSYIIKRLCLGNPRGKLKDQNPKFVLEIMEKLNSEPMCLAIWSDTTTCIDVGDILLSDRKRNIISCIELKEGRVNEIIEHLLESRCEREMYLFLNYFKEKGFKQLKRTIKQHIKYGQVLKLLKEKKGYDPAISQEKFIIEVQTPDEFYHERLNEVINTARYKGFKASLIDKCLWLFAFDQTKLSYSYAIREFSKLVTSHDKGQLKKWLSEFSPESSSNKLYPIHNLKSGLRVPISLPIFLYNISSRNILDVLLDRIVVLMFLNWNEFKNLFMEKGFYLTWSSKKEGRKEKAKPLKKRLLTIGDRIPIIKTQKHEIELGAGTTYRIYYNGIRPKCIVDQYYEAYMKNL